MTLPPIPPESKFFKASGSVSAFHILVSGTGKGVFYYLSELSNKDWRFIIAAVAIEEWRAHWKQGEDAPAARSHVAEMAALWRAWAEEQG